MLQLKLQTYWRAAVSPQFSKVRFGFHLTITSTPSPICLFVFTHFTVLTYIMVPWITPVWSILQWRKARGENLELEGTTSSDFPEIDIFKYSLFLNRNSVARAGMDCFSWKRQWVGYSEGMKWLVSGHSHLWKKMVGSNSSCATHQCHLCQWLDELSPERQFKTSVHFCYHFAWQRQKAWKNSPCNSTSA